MPEDPTPSIPVDLFATRVPYRNADGRIEWTSREQLDKWRRDVSAILKKQATS